MKRIFPLLDGFIQYPLANKHFAIEHDPFSSLIYPLKVVIFHSYVSLPGGNLSNNGKNTNYHHWVNYPDLLL